MTGYDRLADDAAIKNLRKYLSEWRSLACVTGMHDMCNLHVQCKCVDCGHTSKFLEQRAALELDYAKEYLRVRVAKIRYDLGLPPDYYAMAL